MSPIRASGRTVTGQRAPTGHSQRAAAMSTRYADFGTSLRMKGEAIDAADQQVQSWWVNAATHTPKRGVRRSSKRLLNLPRWVFFGEFARMLKRGNDTLRCGPAPANGARQPRRQFLRAALAAGVSLPFARAALAEDEKPGADERPQPGDLFVHAEGDAEGQTVDPAG